MILIVGGDDILTASISEMLYFMGIPSKICTSRRVSTEINARYQAIIYTKDLSSASEAELIRGLRFLTLGAPMIGISRGDTVSAELRPLFEAVITCEISPSILKRTFAEVTPGIRGIGAYRLIGIDASVDLDDVYFHGEPIEATRTEAMIIRAFIGVYPSDVSAKELLSLAFRRGREPEASAIRTHVHAINKKFITLFDRKLIESFDGAYRIIMPKPSKYAMLDN